MFGEEIGWFKLNNNDKDEEKEMFERKFENVEKVVKKEKEFD
jgi:hypothetical protein